MVDESHVPDSMTEREAAVLQRDRLRQLTGGAEWGKIVEFIEQQSNKRVLAVMTLQECDEKSKAEVNYTKGEYAGLQLVKVWIETELGAAENLLELYREQARIDSANE